jgi:hypothetical protein
MDLKNSSKTSNLMVSSNVPIPSSNELNLGEELNVMSSV